MSLPADLPATSGLAEPKKLSTRRIVFLVDSAPAGTVPS